MLAILRTALRKSKNRSADERAGSSTAGFSECDLVHLVVLLDPEDSTSWPSPYEAYPVENDRELRYLASMNARTRSDTVMIEGNKLSPRANNLGWPRPVILPKALVPADFNETSAGEDAVSRFTRQQTDMGYFAAPVGKTEMTLFEKDWKRRSYRTRCHIWSLWQRHLKDWWFFLRWPLVFLFALSAPAYYVYQLLASVSGWD